MSYNLSKCAGYNQSENITSVFCHTHMREIPLGPSSQGLVVYLLAFISFLGKRIKAEIKLKQLNLIEEPFVKGKVNLDPWL